MQYSTPLPNDDGSSQPKTPTPAVRPAPGGGVPPIVPAEPAEERKPTLLPAPPAELTRPLAEPPSEPAAGGETVIPSPAFPAENSPFARAESNNRGTSDLPDWAASNVKTSPNAPRLERALNKNGGDYQQDCLSVKDLKPIDKIETDITVQGEVPKDCPWGNEEKFAKRSWQSLTYTWTASALCHKPLYFEDVKLERYGHMWGPWLQPIVSHARFFAIVPILPYEMGLEPPHECMYALGYYRPGSCAPYYLDPIPLSVRAALFEAGAWVGGVAIIP
ncbi:MAG: hypothetical protein IT426_07540 [Pirellulales bacterium]|nr:hypothetical protein [Pirellulales bacterium]